VEGGFRFRLIDTDGSELGIVTHEPKTIGLGETVQTPDGEQARVVDIYDDDEHGREGGVEATLAVEII
jgi:hypothetical protein